MTSRERYGRVMELFERVCDLPAPQRDAILGDACEGDVELLEDVRALLDCDSTLGAADAAGGGAVVEALAADLDVDLTTGTGSRAERQGAASTSIAFEEGSRVGPYRIVREIGHGGMGVIYEAEQEAPRRRVALKVIRPGRVTADGIRRFRHEAQILGRLQHPDIAQVFEAGLTEPGPRGVPYFAMELIDGVPLDRYVEEEALDLPRRVALLARVCDAVQHAHQKGIIHRDLKPANVLVMRATSGSDTGTSDSSVSRRRRMAWFEDIGQPKVLDFGVARVVDPDAHLMSAATDAGILVGTLAYMSPEQVGGPSDGLDTRCDVYALGVMAYEVLSGARPLDVGRLAIPEAARRIEATDPARLSSHDSRLHGDLETIVHKALEKDRERRYASAGELAADLRRYLADEPIHARPPSAFYQISKFARRNRALVSASAIGILGLVIALVGVTTGLVASQRELARSREIRGVITDMLVSVRPNESLGEDTSLMKRVLRETVARLDAGDVRDLAVEGELRGLVGSTYRLIQEPEAALVQLDRAVSILGGGGGRASWSARIDRAAVLQTIGRGAEAESILLEAVDACERRFGAEDGITLGAKEALGIGYLRDEKWDEAEGPLLDVAESRERRLGPEDESTLATRSHLAILYAGRGDFDAAERIYRESVALQEPLADAGDPRALGALHNLATLLIRRERVEEAIPYLEQTLVLTERAFGVAHDATREIRAALAVHCIELGRVDDAARRLREVVRLDLLRGTPSVSVVVDLVDLLHRSGRPQEAARIGMDLLDPFEHAVGRESEELLPLLSLLGSVCYDAGDAAAQERVTSREVEVRRAHDGITAMESLVAINNLASLFVTQGRAAEARSLLEPVLEVCRAEATPSLPCWVCAHSLAEAHLAGNDFESAASLLEEVVDGYDRVLERDPEDEQTYAFRMLALQQQEAAWIRAGETDRAEQTAARRRAIERAE